MKEIKVTVNTWYVVEGAAGATVINPLTNRAIATVEDGKQASFLATTPYVVASDDSVNVFKAPFNSAPAKLKLLGLLGGGSSTGLPAGYLAAEFVQFNGNVGESLKIPTECVDTDFFAFESRLRFTNTNTRNTELSYPEASATRGIYWGTGRNSFIWGAAGNIGLIDGSDTKWHHFHLEQSDGPKAGFWIDGVLCGELEDYIVDIPIDSAVGFGIGGAATGPANKASDRAYVAHRDFRFYKNGVLERDFVPCLHPHGYSCFYDRVTQTPFYLTGTNMWVGMTLEQAHRLEKLAAPQVSGDRLLLILPDGWSADVGASAAIEAAKAKGWTIHISMNEDDEGSFSTYGMRRIWVRREQYENGSYVDADGNRWQVDWCVTMYTPDDSTPDMHGYELFRSVEAACDYWGLTPYVDPEWEEELLTETN